MVGFWVGWVGFSWVGFWLGGVGWGGVGWGGVGWGGVGWGRLGGVFGWVLVGVGWGWVWMVAWLVGSLIAYFFCLLVRSLGERFVCRHGV